MRYKIWNRTDRLFTPSGDSFSAAEVLAKDPLAQTADFIICDAPINMGVFMEFTQTKATYKQMGVPITDEMTTQEVLDAISYFEENPPIPEPTADERIAAAMEYDNLMKY